jgi:hypothetical protein
MDLAVRGLDSGYRKPFGISVLLSVRGKSSFSFHANRFAQSGSRGFGRPVAREHPICDCRRSEAQCRTVEVSGEDWDNFVKERGTAWVEPRMGLVVQRDCGDLEIRNLKITSARRIGLVRHRQSVGFRGVAFGYP